MMAKKVEEEKPFVRVAVRREFDPSLRGC